MAAPPESESPEPSLPPTWRQIPPWLPIAAVLVLWLIFAVGQGAFGPSGRPRDVPWSELVAAVDAGRSAEILVRPTDVIVTLGEDDGGSSKLRSDRLPNVDESALFGRWQERGLTIRARSGSDSGIVSIVVSLAIPLLLFVLLGIAIRRSLQGRANAALDFGRGKPKIFDQTAERERVTFDDVAGVDEAKGELLEMIQFLKNPERYRSIGARIPKGTLLVGPPGTGKTLLARAVAGEAGVPFFSISGSEFVEMFVGVGASRVRDLFEQARGRAPCIVFIDELDAVGKSRGGVATMGSNDEREQTLNQLLVEMDGFDPRTGVVIMAATNRPEILDPALLRAGRFDRRVVVGRPDINGRLAILAVHARNVSIDPSIDLQVIARRTPGMVGADLAKVVNEAALAAVRRSSKRVEQRDFDEAVDRIQLGLEQKGRAMSPSEIRRVAYHEAGHALVAMRVEHADPVHKVTIIPRSIGALGATLQLPTEDRYLVTKPELLDRIAVLLGGRAAEALACGDVSTGAENDFEQATRTARMMVSRYGMSDALGLATTGNPPSPFLGGPFEAGSPTSEHTARLVDDEIRRILDEQYQRAYALLETERSSLESVVDKLLEEETIDQARLYALVDAPPSDG